MDSNIEEAVLGVEENHPYVAVAVGDSTLQVHLTAERCLLGSTSNAIGTLVALISIYYICNIAYPKSLFPVCIFLQHFVFHIVDKQKVPDVF